MFSNFSHFGEEIKIELSPEQENQKKLEPIFFGPMNIQNKYFIGALRVWLILARPPTADCRAFPYGLPQ